MFFQSKVGLYSKYLFVVTILLLWPLVSLLGLKSLPLPQSVFKFDYQARQEVLRRTYMYPSVFLARVFQNKLQVPISKIENNLTSILDPNNYFFGFHPREIAGVNSPVKFPIVSLPFFLIGVLNLNKYRRRRLLVGAFVLLVLCLSLIENYYYFDFPLYLPLALIFVWGVKSFPAKYNRPISIYYMLSLPMIIIELVRQIIILLSK